METLQLTARKRFSMNPAIESKIERRSLHGGILWLGKVQQ